MVNLLPCVALFICVFFRSSWWVWVKRALIAICTLYVATPFVLRFFPSVVQYLVYKHASAYIAPQLHIKEYHLCGLLHPEHYLSLFSNILCWPKPSLWCWPQSHCKYVPDLRSRSHPGSMVSCAFCKDDFCEHAKLFLLFLFLLSMVPLQAHGSWAKVEGGSR